jgi:hypothetical protein
MDGMWKNIRAGNGDWTMLRPDGSLLGPDIQSGWAKWKALPLAERKPDAYPLVKVKELPPDAPPHPPEGALVVRISQRNLQRKGETDFVRLTEANTAKWCRTMGSGNNWLWHPRYNDSFRDVMWLLEDEWKSLIPADPKRGDRLPLPEAVKKRMLLWHLTNRTFCVGIAWEEKDIRSENLRLTVEEVTPVLRLRLEGTVLLKMDGGPEDTKIFWGRSEHGYDTRVLGFLNYDPAKNRFTRFDILSIGDYWGGDAEGARRNVGRLPLGICFELPSKDDIRDQSLPCGGVVLQKYLKLVPQFQ